MQWSESEGHRNSYTALAIGSDGSNLSCGTSSTTCTINSLACGITYSIAVSTANVNCATIEGSDYRIQSGKALVQSQTTTRLTVHLNCLDPRSVDQSIQILMEFWDSYIFPKPS